YCVLSTLNLNLTVKPFSTFYNYLIHLSILLQSLIRIFIFISYTQCAKFSFIFIFCIHVFLTYFIPYLYATYHYSASFYQYVFIYLVKLKLNKLLFIVYLFIML